MTISILFIVPFDSYSAITLSKLPPSSLHNFHHITGKINISVLISVKIIFYRDIKRRKIYLYKQ